MVAHAKYLSESYSFPASGAGLVSAVLVQRREQWVAVPYPGICCGDLLIEFTSQLFSSSLTMHLQKKIEKMMHKDTGAGSTGTDTYSSSTTAHQKPGVGQNVTGALVCYDATTSTGTPQFSI